MIIVVPRGIYLPATSEQLAVLHIGQWMALKANLRSVGSVGSKHINEQ